MLNSLLVGVKSPDRIVESVFKLGTCVQAMFLTQVLASDVLNTVFLNNGFCPLVMQAEELKMATQLTGPVMPIKNVSVTKSCLCVT